MKQRTEERKKTCKQTKKQLETHQWLWLASVCLCTQYFYPFMEGGKVYQRHPFGLRCWCLNDVYNKSSTSVSPYLNILFFHNNPVLVLLPLHPCPAATAMILNPTNLVWKTYSWWFGPGCSSWHNPPHLGRIGTATRSTLTCVPHKSGYCVSGSDRPPCLQPWSL